MDRKEKLIYLKQLAADIINECTFVKDTKYFTTDNKMGLLLPSGDELYKSFWVRDCAMMAESGLLADDEYKKYIEIIASYGQNGSDGIKLENNLYVPPYTIADHINYDCKPVYFPGTYNSGNNQGNGKFGHLPPLGDNYYFILMVCDYIKQTGDEGILYNEYSGMILKERIEKAFEAYNIDAKNQLCCNDNVDYYAVDWGFCDTIKKSGYLLMPSILRLKSAQALSEVLPDKKEYYTAIYKVIANNIPDTFYDEETGWLISATKTGRQYDVWLTAFAVYCDILPKNIEMRCCEALKKAYLEGKTVYYGAVRSIPVGNDFNSKSMWECASSDYGIYQNGGYWDTSTGWYYYALHKCDEKLAEKLIDEFIDSVKSNEEAPFEWISSEHSASGGKRYGTSGVLPYIAYKKV